MIVVQLSSLPEATCLYYNLVALILSLYYPLASSKLQQYTREESYYCLELLKFGISKNVVVLQGHDELLQLSWCVVPLLSILCILNQQRGKSNLLSDIIIITLLSSCAFVHVGLKNVTMGCHKF